MSEQEISLFAEETRAWVEERRSRRPADSSQPYIADGSHVVVGKEKPLAADFSATSESADANETIR